VSTTPTVFFIDDSATMREVIKIAFKRENINVVAYNDAATALSQFEKTPPDVVITDVIMPDKDGYEVCNYIKQHTSLGRTPVILMSGVVNKAVAEKAFSVKADELIRKPFQPQDLITRVKHLLYPNMPAAAQEPTASAAATLSSIFQQPAAAPVTYTRPTMTPSAPMMPKISPIAAAFNKQPRAPQAAPAPTAHPPMPQRPVPVTAPAPASAGDLQKLRVEVLRLEGLVKKLQSELAAEREYSRALEEHVKTLQESD